MCMKKKRRRKINCLIFMKYNFCITLESFSICFSIYSRNNLLVMIKLMIHISYATCDIYTNNNINI